MKKPLFVAITVAGALVWPTTLPAEEGGSAHYLPGSAASFIDAFPGIPGGLAVLNYFTYYDASASPSRQLPLNGLLTAGVDATVHAASLTAVYQTPWNLLGGGFAAGVSVPYVWVEVDATAQRINPGGVPGPVFTASDSANGVGDFKGHTYGVGPVLSYVLPMNGGKAQLLAEVKWLPELDTGNRLEGDYVWFKLGILF